MKSISNSIFGLFSCALSISALSFVTGCSAETAETESAGDDALTSASIRPGNFKLYAEPGTIPVAGCDVHTNLALSASGANFSEAVSGFCEIYVAPNPREYRLRLASEECGSKTYKGSARLAGKRRSVTITDNRTRLCDSGAAAAIVVEETVTGEGTTKSYSFDGLPSAALVTLDGVFASSVGIGGENTGASLRTSTGLIELILDGGELDAFAPGQKARVKGNFTTLNGVETRARQALDVKEILVCPSNPINCMPGPFRLSSLCSGENLDWIQGNCPDARVSF